MSSKRVSFASALVCAAFVPQAMGVCASGNSGVITDKGAEKYKDYLDKGKGVVALNEGKEDDDFDGGSFGFNVQTKKKTVRRGGVLSKVFNRASSFRRRHRKLVDLSKKVAVYGGLGYGIVNFTGPTVDIISRKSALDKSLIPSGVGQNISGLMLNPNVDFRFLLNDVDKEKKLNLEGKKESVGDIANFLSAFEKMYKNTGINFDIEKFESGVGANFDTDKDSDRMSRFCKNLVSLPKESIAKNLALDGDLRKIAELLDLVSQKEYYKVNGLLSKAGKSEYHGFGNGGEDVWKDIKNIWSGAKDAAIEVGGEVLSSAGSSLTMALPDWYKLWGLLSIALGALAKNYSNEQKMKNQKDLRS